MRALTIIRFKFALICLERHKHTKILDIWLVYNKSLWQLASDESLAH